MLGELLSLGSAVAWAAAVVLYKKSDQVHPEMMNLFKNVFGVVVIGLTLWATGDAVAYDRSLEDWVRLAVSGVVGIAIADTMIFAALQRLGASVMAVVETAYAPTMVVLSILFLGDGVGWSLAVGGSFVVIGVYLASRESATTQGPLPKTLQRPARAIALGVGGIVLMAGGIVLAKPALDRGAVIEVTWIRLVAGTAAQLLVIVPRAAARRRLSIFRPQRVWRTLVPASFFGGYLAMILWIGGMKYTTVSAAAILGQMATVFTLLFARMFLGEPITPRRLVGALIAVTGAIVLLA